MSDRYFVMLRPAAPFGKAPIPVLDDNDAVLLFDSEEAARIAMATNSYAAAYGFEVYPWIE